MEIKPPATIIPAVPAHGGRGEAGAAALRALTGNWQIGQIFEAVVSDRSARGHLVLSLRGVNLEVARPPDLPFQAGQRVQLQLSAREPLPTFRLLNLASAATTTAGPGQHAPLTLQQALRAEVPRQQALPPLLANLAQAGRPDAAIPPLPEPVQAAINRLLQQLPTPQQLRQPGGLHQALLQSGLFLEAHLAQAARGAAEALPRVETDLRTALLRLAESLRQQLPAERSGSVPGRSLPVPPPAAEAAGAGPASTRAYQAAQPAPPVPQHGAVRLAPQPQGREAASLLTAVSQENALEELLRQVDGVLARQHVQQLHSQHAEQQHRSLWAMELPLRNGEAIDLFDLRIEREAPGRQAQGGPMPWTVSLAFELEGLGPVRAVVSLRNEQISTAFWAEQEATAGLFNQYLDLLHSQLAALGVEVGRLECRCGMPPATEAGHEPSLVDEQA